MKEVVKLAARRAFRQASEYALGYDPEALQMKAWVARLAAAAPSPLRILDVGCGHGRNLRWLVEAGYDVTGVEVNEAIVASNVAQGLPCVTVETFKASDARYDLVLMSHIIEHFTPRDLLAFIESYLEALRPGGHLLIATPLLSPYFFDDFDHVRPYHPNGLLMLFGGENAQVQYQSRFKLTLADLWYRRGPFRFTHLRTRQLGIPSRALGLSELASAMAFRLSGDRIGRVDGWLGLFRKD